MYDNDRDNNRGYGGGGGRYRGGGGGGGGYRGGGGGGRGGDGGGGGYQQRERREPPAALASEKIEGERKTFFLDLRENDRGRFIKITEDVRGRRDTIMLPDDCFEDFYEALGNLLDHGLDDEDKNEDAAEETEADDAAPEASDDSEAGEPLADDEGIDEPGNVA